MIKHISSQQNGQIKTLIQLKDKSRYRKQTGLFLIEGYRELALALKGNYSIKTIYFVPELCNQSKIGKILIAENSSETELISIDIDIYKKIAHRDTTEGVLATSKMKNHTLSDLEITSKNPLILVAESIEKPGNIGALLRTADAANLDAVLLANPKTDLYNPNCIRSSVGCLFTNKVVLDSTENIINYLKQNKFNIYSAILNKSSKLYQNQDFTKPTALVVGTEATGLNDIWLKESTQNIIIPMQGKIDSMNVSVSAAILIFEAKRQRNFK